jgi:small subunit ribosomal protein S6
VPTYETIFITPPNLAEEDERATVESLAQIVTAGGGTFTVQERMGRRRLAYPIKKHEDGVYIRLLYDSEADVPKELERRFRLSDKVLRYLTVHLDPDWAQFEKEEAVREAKRRAEAEAAEAARQKAAKEEAERKAAAEAEEAARKAAEAAEASDDEEPAAEAAPASDEGASEETAEPPAADEAETEKA